MGAERKGLLRGGSQPSFYAVSLTPSIRVSIEYRVSDIREFKSELARASFPEFIFSLGREWLVSHHLFLRAAGAINQS